MGRLRPTRLYAELGFVHIIAYQNGQHPTQHTIFTVYAARNGTHQHLQEESDMKLHRTNRMLVGGLLAAAAMVALLVQAQNQPAHAQAQDAKRRDWRALGSGRCKE
jgi:hypothetical protein